MTDTSADARRAALRDQPTMRRMIAAALSELEGIEGHDQAPRTIGQGQGWPELVSITPRTMNGAETEWDVFVTLPAGLLESAAVEASALLQEALDALELLGVVERVQPGTITTQQGGSTGTPCLIYTMTTI